MTTSSDHRTPAPAPCGKHWNELTATLSPESTEEFGTWLSKQLTALEERMDAFVTPHSLRKSLRR